MTREDAVAPDVSGVVDELEAVRFATGYGLGRVFRDWMAVTVHAFERDDDAYAERLDRVQRHHSREVRGDVAKAFSRALGELVLATCDAQRPVVGDIYEAFGEQADEFGQFFTPWSVSRAKADLVITPTDARDATPGDPLTVADPACGSARLLVAAAKALHEHDPDAPILVSGTDKDATCARMAVVNLVIAGVPGRIRHGDSLTQEVHREWRIQPDRPGPDVLEVDDDVDEQGEGPVDEERGTPDAGTAPAAVEQAGLGEWSG